MNKNSSNSRNKNNLLLFLTVRISNEFKFRVSWDIEEKNMMKKYDMRQFTKVTSFTLIDTAVTMLEHFRFCCA